MPKYHKKSKQAKVPYHKKPEEMTVEQWQTELRRQFARDGKQKFTIKYLGGEHPVFGDYSVKNLLSGGSYKVALRSGKPGPNFCTCMDFKTNGLGTCKHIEAILFEVGKNKKLAALLEEEYQPVYSSLYLKYGQQRQVCLRIGKENKEKYQKLAKDFFDGQHQIFPAAVNHIENFLAKAASISPDFRCYDDAMDFILKLRDDGDRSVILDEIGNKYFDKLLKTRLYPYQKQGILFAARAGRALIADEMGLGKTLQAIGEAELLKKEFRITSVLIVCPTSLKYQWKSEIEKFTNSKADVIEGNFFQRQKQYDKESFYRIASYNVVGADFKYINKMAPDLVILDEAQRIKNWQTRTAREVKKIQSKYALVLTGTPIENKLEELYSIVQFIDPFKLGPLYKFLQEHQIAGDNGKVIGYRELNKIQEILSDIVIRRTKKQVMAQLPKRTDKNLFVPMTEPQAEIHSEYADMVARLVNKWKRFGFLNEKDRQFLMLGLNCMRMVSDSTFILDQETRYDTKIKELMAILDNVFEAKQEKVVVFSQWERMTRLVKMELEDRKVGFAYLHGGIPGKNRKALLDDFRDKIDCRVFLSTDAGSVGLNLQSASLVVNLDIPWNPAVLEQRIGRVHRHGQTRNVNVVNLISKDSIEERMLEVLKFKFSLFSGVLDNGANEIFMGESKFKKFMSSVEKMAVAPMTTVPVTDVEATLDPELAETDEHPTKTKIAHAEPEAAGQPATDFFATAAGFFNNLSQTLADKDKTQKLVSSLIVKDAVTGKKYLKLPINNEETVNKTIDVLVGLLSAFKK